MNKLYSLIALLVFGVASAQDVNGYDVSSLKLLGQSVFALGFFVFGAVASVKRATELQGKPVQLNAWAWRGLAFLAGLAGAFVLHASGAGASLPLFGATDTVAVLYYGVVSGLLAIIGRDGLKTVIAWVIPGLNLPAGSLVATSSVTISGEAPADTGLQGPK